MSDQKFALINRQTGNLLGLTNYNVDTPSLDSWALDEECLYFLEALQAYSPKHIFTTEDIKWYYHICQTRESFDWDVLPNDAVMLNNEILSAKLKFHTWLPMNKESDK
jgi:hypothetical protein